MIALYNNRLTNLETIPTFINHINVYDALRIQDGIALFAEDHYNRLINSVTIAGYKYEFDFDTWQQKLYTLIHNNNVLNGNLRTDLFYSKKVQFHELFQIYKAKYPTTDDYKNGIISTLQYDERLNPNAKIANKKVRGHAEQIIKSEHVYETILVNNNNQITEGSRTNIFAIINSELITAPDSMVLPGIMRSKVIAAAHEQQIPIQYAALSPNDIPRVQSLFFSGTSPRVLPISKVNDIEIPIDNKLMFKIKDNIETKIFKYIKSKKNRVE